MGNNCPQCCTPFYRLDEKPDIRLICYIEIKKTQERQLSPQACE